MKNAISKEKVEGLAKASHARCHGRGILGFRPGTNAVILCSCVNRNLRRHGVNADNRDAVLKYLAPDPPKEEEVPCPTRN